MEAPLPPEKRKALVEDARRRAARQPGLSQEQRQNLCRLAHATEKMGAAADAARNNRPANRAALAVLHALRVPPDPDRPHLLLLLMEAFDRDLEVHAVPPNQMLELRQAVAPLWNSPPAAVRWLLGDANSSPEREATLAQALRAAPTPEAAMVVALEAAWDRLRAA